MKNKNGAMSLYLISRWFYLRKMNFFAKLFYHLNQLLFCCSIHYIAEIDKTVYFAHSRGITIHPNTKIGQNTIVFQNVTMGVKRAKEECEIKIGKNCEIGAGACILGFVNVGDNVVVGANSVITKNIESNCIVAGVPAKVIKKIEQ